MKADMSTVKQGEFLLLLLNKHEVKNMAEKIEVMISEEKLMKRIDELAKEINEDYAGKELLIICILKGSVFFSCELAKRLTVPVTFDFMQVSSYGDGTSTTGSIKIIKDLDGPITGKEVLIVEDILDSGRTLCRLLSILSVSNPASLRVCTLLDKPSRREFPVDVDYNGFEIEDEFVVGFGLDYAQKYRNLPYIGIVRFEN